VRTEAKKKPIMLIRRQEPLKKKDKGIRLTPNLRKGEDHEKKSLPKRQTIRVGEKGDSPKKNCIEEKGVIALPIHGGNLSGGLLSL